MYKLRVFRSILILGIVCLIAAFCGWGVPAFAGTGPVAPELTAITLPGGIALFAGKKPTNLGVQEGKLAPCPNSPNCVSSQSSDAAHQVEAMTYRGSAADAIASIKTAIQSLPKTKVVTETSTYLYAEFTSALMGFVDDVEFYCDEATQTLHVRSASRLGYSDAGVNRKRVETLRAKLWEAGTLT